MNRRSFLSGAVALPFATIILPRTLWAAMPKYAPEDFGPVGSGDDTAAWQGALNAARSYNGGRGGIVVPDSRPYLTGALDLTGAQNVIIDAPLGCWIYGHLMTTPAPIFDLTNSNNCWLRGFVTGAQNWGGVQPLAGVLLAESTAGGSNKNRLDNIGSVGAYGSAPICIIGSTDNQFYSCGWQQDHPSSPCLNLSILPDWYISSQFKTITTSGNNMGETTFVGCEFHGYRGLPPGQYWTIYMRGADNARFVGGLCDCSGTSHFLFQGLNQRITSVGQKFYTESGVSPKYLFEDQGTCHDLCVINPGKSAGSFTVAVKTGPFPNYREL